jgi:NAD(P)-dependent dehydrogenase (short-subunit alcohol dehydrogenase family)
LPAVSELDFSAQVAIVTGGCRGIGRAIAEAFLSRGADVVICCRHEPDSPPAAKGRAAVFVAADVREPEQVETVVQAAVTRFGRIDTLINNAGGAPPADAATASPRFSAAIINLNLLAPLLCAQKANAVMQGQPTGGLILNIASVSGMRPSPGSAAYGAAKAGLINLTQTLAVEWAPNVRVNCVTAGLVQTEQSHLHYGDEAGVAAVGATVPLGRMAVPADIADACLLMASPLGRYVSGANLVVHGGGERPAFLAAANATPPAPASREPAAE